MHSLMKLCPRDGCNAGDSEAFKGALRDESEFSPFVSL